MSENRTPTLSDMVAPLQPGNELHCPHCRRWHPVIIRHTEGTRYTTEMLYWECRGASYYAGQVNTVSRHLTRRPAAHTRASLTFSPP